MALLEIRLFPDPVLRQPAAPVETFDEALRRLVADMIRTMRAAPGVGLAANQVGRLIRVAVVDASGGEDPAAVRVLINPSLVEERGRQVDLEGCLSIPEFSEQVERPEWIRLRTFDTEGREHELEAEGFEARAICHELDHLEGVLFTDRLRGLRAERARRHLRRLERSAVEVGV